MDPDISFLFTSLLSGYPDEKSLEHAKTLFSDISKSASKKCQEEHLGKFFHILMKLQKELLLLFSEKLKLKDLQGDYIDLFDKGSLSPLYETGYVKDPFNKAKERSDICGFYQAFGFQLGNENQSKEMSDHISVELEFYALLLIKQKLLEEQKDKMGVDIVFDARKKFLKDHLGRFVTSISEQPMIQRHFFYSHVFEGCKEIVVFECEKLNVIPEPLYSYLGDSESEEIQCGVLSCPKVF